MNRLTNNDMIFLANNRPEFCAEFSQNLFSTVLFCLNRSISELSHYEVRCITVVCEKIFKKLKETEGITYHRHIWKIWDKLRQNSEFFDIPLNE